MSAFSKQETKIKDAETRQKYIVYGYSRKMEKLLPKFDKYYSIPNDIIDIILLYYSENLKFNREHHGKEIIFINDTTITKNEKMGTNVCIFGDEITSKQCNKFKIYIKWVQCKSCIDMGFLTSSIQDSIGDYQAALGQGENKEKSVAFFIAKTMIHTFEHSKHSTGKKSLHSSTPFGKHSIFALEFNFVADELVVYHNDDKVDIVSLHGCKSIIPALSIDKDEILEITKCEFE